MHHRERHWMRLDSGLSTDTDRNQQLRLNISMKTRILRLEDEFWRIRTDTGELAETERNALRAYLDEKGFKTAMIEDNLVIAGKLTWTEVFEPIEGFYEGKADVFPF
jgi:nicotinic acid phosphoribosyltransferase